MKSPTEDETFFHVYSRRWYILATFSLLGALQSLNWMTFSPVAQNAEDYYETGKNMILLLLNWGPLSFFVAILPCMWLLTKPWGLRYGVVIGAGCCLFGALLRVLPSVMYDTGHLDNFLWRYRLYFINAGQFFNDMVGAVVMAAPSRLSTIWFPASERTTATAISALSINLGAASAFILGPALVNQPGDMSMYMYVTAAISFLVALPIFAFFPAAPPTPPSVAAQSILAAEGARQDASILSINATFDHEDLPFAKRRQDSSFDIGLAITEANAQRMSSATSIGAIKGASNALFESGGASTLGIASAVLDNDVPPLAFDSLWQELWYCMTHPSFACLALSGGFVLGVYNGWAGSFDIILEPAYSQTEIGWLGFAALISSTAGGLLFGFLGDMKPLRRQFKLMLFVLLLMTLVFFGWFWLSLPSSYMEEVLPSNYSSLLIAVSLGSFFLFGCSPLYYELGIELTFPASGGTSGGIITTLNNLGCLVYLVIALFVPETLLNTLMVLTTIICCLMILLIVERYNRAIVEHNL